MFAEFDPAALQIFLQCTSTTLHMYFTIVTHAKQHLTNYYSAVFYMVETMLYIIK